MIYDKEIARLEHSLAQAQMLLRLFTGYVRSQADRRIEIPDIDVERISGNERFQITHSSEKEATVLVLCDSQ